MASGGNGEPSTAPQPNRWYDLRLGSSCRDPSPTAKFCTLRYEFKPASIDKTQAGSLQSTKDNRVTVEFHNNQPGKPKVTFEGSQEEYKDNDGVLFFDGETFRLERLHRAVKRLRHVRVPGESAAANLTATTSGMGLESHSPPSAKVGKSQMSKPAVHLIPVEVERIDIGEPDNPGPRYNSKTTTYQPVTTNPFAVSPDQDDQEENLDILGGDDDNGSPNNMASAQIPFLPSFRPSPPLSTAPRNHPPIAMEGGALDPPDEVLVNRYVLFIDEVAEVIKERGEPPLSLLMASALKGVPPCERQATMQREMLRYRAVVELPAEAILRERKAFRPSAVKKVAVAFTGGDDPVFYRDALEGIETHLLQAADPPQVTSLALRVSWPRDSALRSFPPGALIANADRNILVFYVGPYRPLLSMRGFYLVYDASVNSVAVIPQLPSQSVSMFSHSGIGTGVAVLRHGLPTEYLLAELLLQRDRGRTSCKATLFMWWSSGPAAGRWTQKEVVLPLPSAREEHTSMPTYTFCADTVFAVGNAGLCWVDLLQGILMCDDVLAAQPQFWFIPLPMEKYIRPDAEDRGQPEAHRSMCCVKRSGDHILKFVIMDRNGQHQDHSYVTITTWLLPLISVRTLKWKKSFSVCYGELLDGTALLMPTYPILSMVNDNVVYITVAADLESMHGRPKDIGRYVLSLDMKYKRVSSSFKLPTASGRTPTYIFASTFSSYLHKSLWNEAQQKNEEETSNCSDCIKLQKRVVLPESQKPVLHPPIIDVVRDDVWMPGPTRRCFRSFPHRLSAPGQPSLGSSNSGTATSSEMGLASLTDDPSSTGRTSSA